MTLGYVPNIWYVLKCSGRWIAVGAALQQANCDRALCSAWTVRCDTLQRAIVDDTGALHPPYTLLFLYIVLFFVHCTYFIMPKVSNSSDVSLFACSLSGCTHSFNSKQGLLVHQRTCVTKQSERVQAAQYEAEMNAENFQEPAEGVV